MQVQSQVQYVLYSVQCAGFSVLHVTGTLNQIRRTKFFFIYFFILAFQKHIASIRPKKSTLGVYVFEGLKQETKI